MGEWAAAHKISADCVKVLVKDGFTSMEAICLLEKEDLGAKIPRGQHRLILQAVATLRKKNGQDSHPPEQEVHIQAHSASTPAPGIESDPYIAAITDRLLSAQSTTTPLAPPQPPTARDICQPEVDQPHQPPSNLSWNDPQVFLKMASGKAGTASYYDITDFANLATSAVREEVVGNGSVSGAQLVWRTGPRKPKLSSLTIPQWSVANLAILNRLREDGLLSATSIMDYLSYTTRLYQLFQRYDAVSVFYYDREYRKLQSQLAFRWGTEVTHLQTLWLKEGHRSATTPTTTGPLVATPKYAAKAADGRTICRLYNTQRGCHFKDCRFAHVCSHVGCERTHSYSQHEVEQGSKN